MTNHPNRNRALKTEVDGARFKLSLDTAGNPHILKQWQHDGAGRWHWVIVWAAGHKDKLTGPKAIALHQLGQNRRLGSPPPSRAQPPSNLHAVHTDNAR